MVLKEIKTVKHAKKKISIYVSIIDNPQNELSMLFIDTTYSVTLALVAYKALGCLWIMHSMMDIINGKTNAQ